MGNQNKNPGNPKKICFLLFGFHRFIFGFRSFCLDFTGFGFLGRQSRLRNPNKNPIKKQFLFGCPRILFF
jgi:hypothetical protein